MENRPVVSIVCLSFGRPEYLVEAVAALSAQSYPNTELWVVDNRSRHSDHIAALVGSHPKAKLLSIYRNRGYTGGMNAGLDVATGDYVYFTEDDIVPERECVERLVDYALEHPEAGLLSGMIRNRTSHTIRSLGGSSRFGSRYQKNIVAVDSRDPGRYQSPFFAGYVPGAMIFGSTRLLRTLRGFRRDFFAYWEDDELCLRVARMGRTVVVVPTARVDHFEPTPRPDPSILAYHKNKNFLAVYVLHTPFFIAVKAVIRYGFGTLYRRWKEGADWVVVARAILWLVSNFPRLLLDRWQIRLECRPLPIGAVH